MCTEHSCLLFLLCPALSICSSLEESCLSETRGVRYGLGDLHRSLVPNSQNSSEMLGRKWHLRHCGSSYQPQPGSSCVCLTKGAPNLTAPACPIILLWNFTFLCL